MYAVHLKEIRFFSTQTAKWIFQQAIGRGTSLLKKVLQRMSSHGDENLITYFLYLTLSFWVLQVALAKIIKITTRGGSSWVPPCLTADMFDLKVQTIRIPIRSKQYQACLDIMPVQDVYFCVTPGIWHVCMLTPTSITLCQQRAQAQRTLLWWECIQIQQTNRTAAIESALVNSLELDWFTGVN